jgi:hypothetical protein
VFYLTLTALAFYHLHYTLCISITYIFIAWFIARSLLSHRQLFREVLHYILIKISIPVKLERLIKMCLHEIYSRMQVGNIGNVHGCSYPSHNSQVSTPTSSCISRYTHWINCIGQLFSLEWMFGRNSNYTGSTATFVAHCFCSLQVGMISDECIERCICCNVLVNWNRL